MRNDLRLEFVYCHSDSSQTEKSLVVGSDEIVSVCDASLKSVDIKNAKGTTKIFYLI